MKSFKLETKSYALTDLFAPPKSTTTAAKPTTTAAKPTTTAAKPASAVKAAPGLKPAAAKPTGSTSAPPKLAAAGKTISYMSGPNAKLLSNYPFVAPVAEDVSMCPIALAVRDRILMTGAIQDPVKDTDAKKNKI